jgi:hypothetical protein
VKAANLRQFFTRSPTAIRVDAAHASFDETPTYSLFVNTDTRTFLKVAVMLRVW